MNMSTNEKATLKADVARNYRHPFLSIIDWSRLLDFPFATECLDSMAKKGLIIREFGGPQTYGHVSYSLTPAAVELGKKLFQGVV